VADELHRVVGIDLGTTYSAVAAYSPDDLDSKTIADSALQGAAAAATPSVVRLDSATGGLLVGHEAKNAITGHSTDGETIIEVKREMGSLFTADSLETFGAIGTFAEQDPVRVHLGDAWLRPQEVSALILMRMKQIAEQGLGCEVHDAVVTVPAFFTERQKKATEEAALLAGLYPRQLIPEPTAAAIAYGVDRAELERQVYLVFDLGGGTFDVSIIETRENQIEVIATAGDQRLGGGDFDDAVVAWITEQLGDRPLTDIKRLRMKAAAETAKRELSLKNSAIIDLGDEMESLELERSTFESLIQPILDRSLRQVEEALQFAEGAKGVNRDDVDAVLLVGGSTRIPRVRQMLLDHFEQDESFVRGDANPDTLVARGAAIVAYKFEPTPEFDLSTRPTAERIEEEDDEGFTITLITEHTLGVGVQGGRSDALISRGTKIPASKKKTYSNPALAEHIEASIYQGEGQYIYDNTLVGTVHLDDIEPRPEGYHRFEVEFSLDVNGLLGVQITHLNTGRDYQATFEQSTRIGKLDELAERRIALVRLFATTGRQPAEPAQQTPPAPGDQPISVPAPISVPPPVGAAQQPATAAAPDLDQAEVPPEYRRLVRNTLKVVAAGGAPASLTAELAAFTAAIRSGAAPDTLEDLADRLEEAYDNARR
jgi:molecular chaperone DnaK (HSP70)